MEWIAMKKRRPPHGAHIIISINGGMIGEFRDSLYPYQAYFMCSCGGEDSHYDIDRIEHWMPVTLPKSPEDK